MLVRASARLAIASGDDGLRELVKSALSAALAEIDREPA
jgi:hypothetical protein